ncbi:MAG: DUF559 domain-containing protein [Gemmatimonadales bacterium]|nr:MAG: DUF559 domain-containing protein [Gemmatimonadales bacterium]
MSFPEKQATSRSFEPDPPTVATLVQAGVEHSVTTRRDLLASGYSADTLSRMVERGIFLRLHRGVYHVGPNPTWEAHLQAAVLAAGSGAAVSHTSAAMAWGVIQRRDERQIHISIPAERSVTRAGIRVHRTRLRGADTTRWQGISITTPARTLVDLSGILPTIQLEQALARAVREDLTTRKMIHAAALHRTDRKGSGQLRKLLEVEAAPALTRSRAESLLLEHLRESDLPHPRTNARIEHWEVDFLWKEARLVVEVDGFAWHSSRKAFEQDRRKDQWLESRGFRVLRFTWRQIRDHPLRTVATIARMLPGSG